VSLSTAVTCLAVAFCWGSGPIFDKYALRYLDSTQLYLARFYLIFILLLTPMVMRFDSIRAAVWRADKRLLWALGGSAAVPLLGLFLYYRALGSAEASKVVPFCASYPLFAAVLSMAFLSEPVTPTKLAGTAMVVSGVWLLAKP